MARIRIDFNEDGSIKATKSAASKAVTLLKQEKELTMDKNALVSALHTHLYFVDRSSEETKESVKEIEMYLLKNNTGSNRIFVANVIRSIKFQLKEGKFQGKSPEFVMGKTIEEGLPLLIKYVATTTSIQTLQQTL